MSSSDYRKAAEASEFLPGQHITVIDEITGEQNRYCWRCGGPLESTRYKHNMCGKCGSTDADKYGNRPELKVPKKVFKGSQTNSN